MSGQPINHIGHGIGDLPDQVDVVVIGLGITGAGVALDAVTRGLDVLAVDAHDLAFGTSRWSSKLVHGGLRYLAKGQVGVAHESAVERGVLMDVTAPHLTHAMAMLMPLTSSVSRLGAGVTRTGFAAGDLLRRSAHTPPETLPQPRGDSEPPRPRQRRTAHTSAPAHGSPKPPAPRSRSATSSPARPASSPPAASSTPPASGRAS